MLGEMHQLYLIANILGMGNHVFAFKDMFKATLPEGLQIAAIFMFTSIFIAYLYFRDVLMIVENLWTLLVSAGQLYFIDIAKSIPQHKLQNAIVSPNDSSVLIFKHLSTLQLFPSAFCLLRRILTDFYGIVLFDGIDAIMLIMDSFCNFLFYLKALMITEYTRVSIEMVNAERDDL